MSKEEVTPRSNCCEQLLLGPAATLKESKDGIWYLQPHRTCRQNIYLAITLVVLLGFWIFVLVMGIGKAIDAKLDPAFSTSTETRDSLPGFLIVVPNISSHGPNVDDVVRGFRCLSASNPNISDATSFIGCDILHDPRANVLVISPKEVLTAGGPALILTVVFTNIESRYVPAFLMSQSAVEAIKNSATTGAEPPSGNGGVLILMAANNQYIATPSPTITVDLEKNEVVAWSSTFSLLPPNGDGPYVLLFNPLWTNFEVTLNTAFTATTWFDVMNGQLALWTSLMGVLAWLFVDTTFNDKTTSARIWRFTGSFKDVPKIEELDAETYGSSDTASKPGAVELKEAEPGAVVA